MSYPNPLSNIDIIRYIPNVKVFMRDEIPMGLKTCVINMDESTGPGTHWVAIYKTNNEIYYFDSFGIEPPPEVIDRYQKETGARFLFSTNQIQAPNSTMCGWYCIMFLNQMMGGKSYYDFVYQFDRNNRAINEKIIHDWSKAEHRKLIHSKGSTIKYKLE